MTRRVSDIKVKLEDYDAIALVKPEALLDLVERCGVEKKEELKDPKQSLIGWQLKLFDAEPEWIFVPARVDFADYVRRVAEAITDLAKVTGRSELALLLTLLDITDELPLLPEA